MTVLERLASEELMAGNVALTDEELDLIKGCPTEDNEQMIHKRDDTDLKDK